jgi:hypothetical protein
MVGLNSFFTALRNLTQEITRTANLFKDANDSLEARLQIDPEVDVVEHEPASVSENGTGNGTSRRRLART